jgi:hypothetical protein
MPNTRPTFPNRFLLLPTLMGCLFFSNPILAAWDELGSNEAIIVFVDKASVKRTGDKVQMLSMLELKKSGVNPKTKETIQSIVGFNEFACGNTQYRPLEVKFYSGKRGEGKLVEEQKTPDSVLEPVVNGEWNAGVYNFACKVN